MFDFNEFIMSALLDGIERGESRYRIGLRAVPFYQGGTLTDDDMAAIDEALTVRDAPAVEQGEDYALASKLHEEG